MAGNLQSPEKELRFTRSGQAMLFWLLAAVAAAASVILLATSIYRDINSQLPHPLWAFVPLVCSTAITRVAIRLTRHAYLIVTPLGIEIFPLFRPEEGMRLVTWQEIDSAEMDDRQSRLTLHHNAEKSAGIHLSLKPIRRDRRCLLAKAVLGRLSPRSP
jgi:hypothetical protein